MNWPQLLGPSCFVLLTVSCPTWGGEWPQWRGPDRNGIATDEPKLISSWPEGGPPTVWEYPTPGGPRSGLGSVAVSEGRAFVVISSEYEEPVDAPEGSDAKARKIVRDTIVCLDAHSGDEIWKTERPGQRQGYGTSGTVCVAAGRCYFVSSAAVAYCLSADAGREIWQAKVPNASHASFLVADGLAVVPATQLIALDADTGAQVWTQPDVATSSGSPVLWRSEGAAYLICNMNETVACVELATGMLLWTVPGGLYSSALVSGDHMAVLTNEDEAGLSIYELAAAEPGRLWSFPLKDRGASPVVYDGHVYAMGSGRILCVALATGEQCWEQAVDKSSEIASPIVVDGKLIAVVAQTQLLMMSASPHEPKVLAHAGAGVKFSTSPAIADGRLYLRRDKGVACYDLRMPATSVDVENNGSDQ